MNTSHRTQQEIVDRINLRDADDAFGFETGDLVAFLDYQHAKPFIKGGTTEEEWTDATKGNATPADCIKGYMAFAWDKANNRRGISASRSISHMIAWLWLDGKDELAQQIEEYDHYGKPQLVAVCKEYGIDWKALDDGEWVNEEGDTPRTAEEVLA